MIAFEDLKAKSLNCPIKEEELTKQVGSGEGETVIMEMAAGIMGVTETVEAIPAP